jgi:hypothetical protein
MPMKQVRSHRDLIDDPYSEGMSKRTLTISAAGILGAAVLALGGTAAARATGAFDDGDSQLTGPQADRAIAAALKITGGGTANSVERDSEKGATYEVEVTRKDGSTVDVRLDESLKLVAIDGDSDSGSDSG